MYGFIKSVVPSTPWEDVSQSGVEMSGCLTVKRGIFRKTQILFYFA